MADARRRFRYRSLCAGLAATAVFAISALASHAEAATKRALEYQFGAAGTTASTFPEQGGPATFDQSLNRLYVMSPAYSAENRQLYGFKVESPGNYVALGGNFPISLEELGEAPDLAVDSTTHNIYYSSESTNRIYGFDQTGAPLGGSFPISPVGLKDICGVAVDPSGNIWAGDAEQRKLRRFAPSGTEMPAIDLSTIGNGRPCHLDLDSNSDVYVQMRYGGIYKITAASGYTDATVLDDAESFRDLAVDRGTHRVFVSHYYEFREFNPDGTLFHNTGEFDDLYMPFEGSPFEYYSGFMGLAIDEGSDEVFAVNYFNPRKVLVFGPRKVLPDVTTNEPVDAARTTAVVSGTIGRDGGPEVTECFIQWGQGSRLAYDTGSAPCSPTAPYASSTTEVTAELSSLDPATYYSYRFVARTSNGFNVGLVKSLQTDPAVKDVNTLPATNVGTSTARLNGSLDPDGYPGGTKFYFQYGLTTNYGSFAPVDPPGASAGEAAGTVEVNADVSGLTPGKTYNFRLVASNNAGTTYGENRSFFPSGSPTIEGDYAERVVTDGATMRARISPNGYKTTFHFEFGTEDCSVAACESTPDGEVGVVQPYTPEIVSRQRGGLEPGRLYHFRVVATNTRGTTVGADRVFKTYTTDSGIDNCRNAQARQQSGSTLLLDCRGYELVSAANAGGFDVVSDLVQDQEPLPGYAQATDRALYSIDSGVVPGVGGSPTNLDRDPYVAARDEHGNWVTKYVGLPSNGMADLGAFGSPLSGASENLDTFAFGGKDICDPCFVDGSTNIPVRRSDGTLIEGMAGPVLPPAGHRNPAGFVARSLSGDGSHLIFGANEAFHPNGKSGSVSIYDRDLGALSTQVVSTLPDGTTMTGTVGELGLSTDGRRVVVGTSESVDSAGNVYWHPYLHVGQGKGSVDLAPGTTHGVLYAGMSRDGTKVYFTTVDKLVDTDTDASADLYRSEVDASGPAVLALVSTGSAAPTGNTDACNPVSSDSGNNWNAVGAASPDGCGVVAIGGGGGVSEDGSAVYFLSPERLDGSGVLNEPNLFVSAGGGPKFVATLESDNDAVRNGVIDSEVRHYRDFQTEDDGAFAAFNSSLDLGSKSTFGKSQVYRYAVDAGIDCASCSPALAAATTDTSLPAYGRGLTDDGRVFFSTKESLALRDTNERMDAYEWNDGTVELISMGIGPYDSGLLGVSADGVNAFFFTRDTLVHADVNGTRVKLYTAREGGGSVYTPPPLPCAASDECHGAGTESPGPPSIKTQTGTGIVPPKSRDCGALAERQSKLSSSADRARRQAANAPKAALRRALLRKARKLESQARQLGRKVDACTQSSGGNG